MFGTQRSAGKHSYSLSFSRASLNTKACTLLAKNPCLATLLFLLELEAHSTQTEAHNVKQMRNPKEIIYCKLELVRRRKILQFVKHKIITIRLLSGACKSQHFTRGVCTWITIINIHRFGCDHPGFLYAAETVLKGLYGFHKEKCIAWDIQINHILYFRYLNSAQIQIMVCSFLKNPFVSDKSVFKRLSLVQRATHSTKQSC